MIDEGTCETCGEPMNNADPTSHTCPEKDYEPWDSCLPMGCECCGPNDYEPPDEMLVAKDEKYN